LTSLILSERGYNVIAIDTDSTPNLAISLGIPKDRYVNITPLVRDESLIFERTGSKPGSGWGNIFKLNPRVDDLADKYGITVKNNLHLIVMGSIDTSKQGCLCPAVALAKRFLRYTLVSKKDIVIVDSEAGAEVFGRGLAEHFDVMLTISEPTYKSLLISKEMIRMGRELEIEKIILVINKVVDESLAMKLGREIIDEVPIYLIRYDENLPKIEYKGWGLDKLKKDSPLYSDTLALIEKFMGN
jgi:CO dehydrogenase maturation factor